MSNRGSWDFFIVAGCSQIKLLIKTLYSRNKSSFSFRKFVISPCKPEVAIVFALWCMSKETEKVGVAYFYPL